MGSNPSFLLAADFNRDGNLDLAVVNGGFLFMDSFPFLWEKAMALFDPL
jgi:hypothetical protein